MEQVAIHESKLFGPFRISLFRLVSLIGTNADILTLTKTKLGIVFILFIGRDGSSGTDGVKV